MAAVDGRAIELWPSEVDLVVLFLQNRGRVLSRREILASTSDDPLETELRAVDARVSRLRRKLGRAGTWIRTVHGTGYVFCPPDAPRIRTRGGRIISVFAGMMSLLSAGRAQAAAHPMKACGLISASLGIVCAGAIAVHAPSLITDTKLARAIGLPAPRVAYSPVIEIPSQQAWRFGSFSGTLAIEDDSGHLLSISAGGQPDPTQPAKVRRLRIGADGKLLQVGMETDRLRVPREPVPEASRWQLGIGSAFCMSDRGTIVAATADGSDIHEFSPSGAFIATHDLSRSAAAGCAASGMIRIDETDHFLLIEACAHDQSSGSSAVLLDDAFRPVRAGSVVLLEPGSTLHSLAPIAPSFALGLIQTGDAGWVISLVRVLDPASDELIHEITPVAAIDPERLQVSGHADAFVPRSVVALPRERQRGSWLVLVGAAGEQGKARLLPIRLNLAGAIKAREIQVSEVH